MSLSEKVRSDTMRYLIARWSAFSNLFWLIVNDMHCDAKFPKNQSFDREVGKFFATNEPWKHLISTGPNRHAGFPFTSAEDLKWCSYIYIKVPVLLLEQRIATSGKLGRRPTVEDRLPFGKQLITVMAETVLQ